MSFDEITPRPKRPTTPVLKLPDGRRIVARPGTQVAVKTRALDICFVFDTTGSMSDKIDGLIGCMDHLVGQLADLALDWRVTTVPFGDLTVPGDRIVTDQPFVTDIHAASRQLREMPRMSGGSNYGESAADAMLAACEKPYRPSAVKILVLITDEPALGEPQKLASVHGALTSLDSACFTVTPDRLTYYKEWATKHGGEWRLIDSAVDTSAITRLFVSLLSRMVAVADSVHRLGRGSVRAYLERGDKLPS